VAKLQPKDWRVDEFRSGVDKVEPIRRGGTDVPDNKRKQVEEAAFEAGIELEEVK
jgi:hypothetical protein